MINQSNEIDFVITWVDGGDPEWIKEKNSYLGVETTSDAIDASASRYRDWGTLKYLFRGIEKYAPWVHRVYLITNGQCPDWLNLDNEKVRLVSHSEYMPEEYLPTFSSHPIELNLHRIEGLSEQFVLFNDDTFITDYVQPEDFFNDGLPCDSAVISPIIAGDESNFAHILINNIRLINMNFDKKKTIKKNFTKFFNPKYGKDVLRTAFMQPWKEFVGFFNPHLPNSFLKSTYREVWEKCYEEMNSTSLRKFRNHFFDVNPWLIRYWQLAGGRFVPRKTSFGKRFDYGKDDKALYKALINHRYKLVCLNDGTRDFDIDKAIKRTRAAFNRILSEKSSFEK